MTVAPERQRLALGRAAQRMRDETLEAVARNRVTVRIGNAQDGASEAVAGDEALDDFLRRPLGLAIVADGLAGVGLDAGPAWGVAVHSAAGRKEDEVRPARHGQRDDGLQHFF